ncbi:MAG TPA: hypothetical protein VIS74_08485 [Chthoniobacterales bacterium]
MRLLIRLILLLVAVLAGYALWPRTPHPTQFEPAVVAQLETLAWKSAQNATSLNGTVALYRIYDFQYGLPPRTAVSLSQNTIRSLNIFRTAPDVMDREKALPLLLENLSALKHATKAGFDADAAARQLFTVWTLALQPTPPNALSKAVASYWAILYGKPASAFTGAANAYADALLANGFVPGSTADWPRVETSLTKAYGQLAATLK